MGALRCEGAWEIAKEDAKPDRFDEVVAELNNCGLGSLLAHEHAPELVESLSRELGRYRRLVAELRKVHRGGRPE